MTTTTELRNGTRRLAGVLVSDLLRWAGVILTTALLASCQTTLDEGAERAREALRHAAPSVASLVHTTAFEGGTPPSIEAVNELPIVYEAEDDGEESMTLKLAYRAEGTAESSFGTAHFVMDTCVRMRIEPAHAQWQGIECPDGPIQRQVGGVIERTEAQPSEPMAGRGALAARDLPDPYDLSDWDFSQRVPIS